MVENSMLQRAVEDRRRAIDRAVAAEKEAERLRALLGEPCPKCGWPGRKQDADAPAVKP